MISDNVEHGALSQAYERYAYTPSDGDNRLPEGFNYQQWAQQTARYTQYTHWYSGDALAEIRRNESNEDESQYPLHINTLRGIVRKHAQVLFGEVPDGATPLVKTAVRPKKRFDGKPVPETTKALAIMCEAIINEVWVRSSGRAMQLENGKFSQYMGGSVFQIAYEPLRKDLTIPLVIRNPRPDHFLPEWSNDDYWSLLRGTTVYRFPALTAKLEYGIGDGAPGEWAIYMRQETRNDITVTVDGVPIEFMGKSMKGVGHKFGFVPSVYIPHQLEGAKYGMSHVEDVAALIKEYNARLSDLGTAVLNTVDRETFVSNMVGNPVAVASPVTGKKWSNLGQTPPASGSKDAPKAWLEDVPVVSPSMVQISDIVFRQVVRDSDMSMIPFGEDEGSQRSGETLALRMWPILAHTRGERTHWNDGMSRIGWYILKMVKQIMDENEAAGQIMRDAGIEIPDNYEQLLDISAEWSPQIPQDRTKLVTELSLLKPQGLVSTRQGVTELGNAKDVDAELAEIEKDKKQVADLASQQKPPPFGGSTSNTDKAAVASSSMN